MNMRINTQRDALAILIEDITRALVDRPEYARVHVIEGERTKILEVSVHQKDIGKLVGRGGRSAGALRQMLFAMGGKVGARYTLEILDPHHLSNTEEMIEDEDNQDDDRKADDAFHRDPIAATQALLTRMARAIVDDEDQVRVHALVGNRAAMYELHLAQADVAKILGRNGKTAEALRNLLINLGRKAGRRFILEIIEPAEARATTP